jgi:hypothetical protein
VIAGGRKILAQADLLIIEFWPYGMNRLGGAASEVIDLLRGFRRLSVAVGEDERADELPVAEAIELLESSAQNRIDDSSFYLDVIACR